MIHIRYLSMYLRSGRTVRTSDGEVYGVFIRMSDVYRGFIHFSLATLASILNYTCFYDGFEDDVEHFLSVRL